jgi:putative heme-binding domain-containing protein
MQGLVPKPLTLAILWASLPIYSQNTASKVSAGNPFSGNPQAVAEGQAIYNRACTACHGHEGAGADRAPALAASARRYLRTTDRDLFEAIEKGIPGTMMPASGLSEPEAWKVATYIRSLRGTAIDSPAAGDSGHGEQIFWGKGHCGDCHMLSGKGAPIGPDLSNLAAQRKLSSIRDALTKADHRVSTDGGRHEISLAPADSYQTVRVATRDGRKITGVLRNEDNFSLQMIGLDKSLYLFNRADLRDVTYEPTSLMPTDYDKRLTPPEFQDLLAFLSRQAAGRH